MKIQNREVKGLAVGSIGMSVKPKIEISGTKNKKFISNTVMVDITRGTMWKDKYEHIRQNGNRWSVNKNVW